MTSTTAISSHLAVRPEWLSRRHEAALDPALPIIDPHHHLIDRPASGRYLLPELLADLLPRSVATQVFAALLENAASEQGARMSAMDNATRNAGDMIDRLTTEYNRSRQAAITKELIEIISGAEAL